MHKTIFRLLTYLCILSELMFPQYKRKSRGTNGNKKHVHKKTANQKLIGCIEMLFRVVTVILNNATLQMLP